MIDTNGLYIVHCWSTNQQWRIALPRKSDKRERLLKAARTLIHRQGFHQTTLTDISLESGVTLGNLYYYFKTKEEILSAVVEDRTKRFQALVKTWEKEQDPRKRLIKFLEMPITIGSSIANHGCPVGSLAQELNKNNDTRADLASKPLRVQVDWVTEQFQLLNMKNSPALAHQFIARLQGASLLANSLNQSAILTEQVVQIENWLTSL